MAEQELPSETVINAEGRVALGDDAPGAAAEDEFAATRISSPARDAWRRFRRNKAAILGLSVIVVMVVMAILAPFMHTSDPAIPDPNVINGGPSPTHWFGTDFVGRDGYSRVLYGLRIPLIVGFVGTAITVLIGTVIGVTAGYFGSRVDAILSRFTDVMFAFPAFILALIVVSLFGTYADTIGMGGAGRVLLLTVVFAAVGWPPLMRFVRSLALSMKEQQFVEAARTVGTRDWGIMFGHLLPNMWGLILVQGAFIVVATISGETVLSIFGLTVQQPNPDLGSMLYFGVQNIDNSYWQVLFPGIVLAILILALTFVADGIRDAVDPRGRD